MGENIKSQEKKYKKKGFFREFADGMGWRREKGLKPAEMPADGRLSVLILHYS